MNSNRDLPPAATQAVTRYLDLFDATAYDLLLGLYLVGSVALGDYQDGRSDVDFVAVSRRPFDASAIEALAGIHDAMRGQGPSFDGIYVEAAMLRAWPVTPSIVPFSLDGQFATKSCFETNPATWLCLAQSGVPVRGNDVADLGIPRDDDRLRRFLVGNLQTYWRDWIAQARAAIVARGPNGDGNAAAASWGALGTARIACTIATGRIVSKSAAGAWALEAYPDDHGAIQDALAARRGALLRLPSARFAPVFAFMESVIAREEGARAT